MSSAPQAWPCAGGVRHAQDEVAGRAPEEHPLLASPRRAALLTAGVVALTAVVFALVAGHGTLARIQRVDDAWLRLWSPAGRPRSP